MDPKWIGNTGYLYLIYFNPNFPHFPVFGDSTTIIAHITACPPRSRPALSLVAWPPRPAPSTSSSAIRSTIPLVPVPQALARPTASDDLHDRPHLLLRWLSPLIFVPTSLPAQWPLLFAPASHVGVFRWKMMKGIKVVGEIRGRGYFGPHLRVWSEGFCLENLVDLSSLPIVKEANSKILLNLQLLILNVISWYPQLASSWTWMKVKHLGLTSYLLSTPGWCAMSPLRSSPPLMPQLATFPVDKWIHYAGRSRVVFIL